MADSRFSQHSPSTNRSSSASPRVVTRNIRNQSTVNEISLNKESLPQGAHSNVLPSMPLINQSSRNVISPIGVSNKAAENTVGLPPIDTSFHQSNRETNVTSPHTSMRTIEKLHARLHDAESENERLKNTVRNLEESNRKLRDIASNIQLSGKISSSQKRDSSTQTRKDSIQDKEISILHKRLEGMEQKLLSSLTERDALSKNLSDANRDIASYQSNLYHMKEQHLILENDYTEKLNSLNDSIKQLQEQNISLSQKRYVAPQTNISPTKPDQRLLKKLREFYKEFLVMKNDWKHLKAVTDIYRQSMNTYKQENASSLTLLQSKLHLLLEQFSRQENTWKNQVQLLQDDKQTLVKYVESEKSINQHLRKEIESLKLQIKTEVDINKDYKQKLSLLTSSTDIKQLEEKLKQKEFMINQLQWELRKAYEKSEKRGLIIQQAKQSLLELQDKRSNELQAFRHDTHVKDLSRVANIREITLERDRLLSELQTTREVTNVLTFSLKTAEQTLSETNPDLVSRLVEGRLKRLKEVEKMSALKARDIDQRSAETNSVSSSHLEGFRMKTANKLKSAQDDCQRLFDLVSQLLVVDQ